MSAAEGRRIRRCAACWRWRGEGELRTLSPQPGFISPYPPGRLLLTLIPILAGVWTTYAVVAYQLYAIARNR